MNVQKAVQIFSHTVAMKLFHYRYTEEKERKITKEIEGEKMDGR